MRQLILIAALSAAGVAFTGCSGSDEGSGGGSGTGGTAGTGGGSEDALSFDETTSIPATAGAATAMQASLMFGQVLSSALETIPPPDAAETGLKADFSEFCPSGGSADLDIPPGFPTSWPSGSQVELTLTGCEGSAISAVAVTGSITFVVVGPNEMTPSALDGNANVDLDIADGTMVDGDFAATILVSAGFLQNGRIALFLGEQSDTDRLRITRPGHSFELGCFEIEVLVSRVDTQYVQPLGVAELDGKVYTLNDYTTEPDLIALSSGGVPEDGQLILHSGDSTGNCFPGLPDGDLSQVTASFFAGGCVELAIIDGESTALPLTSTTWDKLLAFDLTPSTVTCNATTEAMAPAVMCPTASDVVALDDAYIRGGTHAETPFQTAQNLLLKGDYDFEYSRKVYMRFDLNTVPAYQRVTLVVTLDRHVSATPQRCDLSGITDNDDWDPAMMSQNPITWSNAPRNDKASAVAFLGQGLSPNNGVRVLVPGYDFDRQDVAEYPDPSGTQYAFDVTEFVDWALGQNNDFSSAADQDDDKIVTLLLALTEESKEDGLSLRSLENSDGEDDCDQPFLHFE